MATRLPTRPTSIVLDDSTASEAAAAEGSATADTSGSADGAAAALEAAPPPAVAEVAEAAEAATGEAEIPSRPRYEGGKPTVYRSGGTYLNEV